MAIGDILTLIKTETVPYYIAFGAMQHLTQVSAKIMSQFPSQIWAEKGVNTKLEIEIISPQHNPLTRFPAGNFGFNSLVGNGATFHTSGNNLVIDSEGSVETHTNTMELDYGTSNTFLGLVGITCRTTVNMSFYVCNGVYYVSLNYGVAGNKGTAWQYKYNMYNQYWTPSTRYQEAYTTLNLHCAPSDDKYLYIDGQPAYTCGAIALDGIYRELTFKFQSTCKLFIDTKSIDEYNATGDDSGSVEKIYPEEEPEIPAIDRQATLYLKCDVMQRSNDPTAAPEKIKSVSIEFVVQYKTNGGEDIGTGNPRTGVVGIVTNTLDSQLFNIWYKQPNDTAKRCKVYKMYVDTGNGRHEVDPKTWTFTSADRLGIYKTEVYKDNNIFYGNIRTNMLIFANEAAAEGYINKEYDPTTGKLPAPILDGVRTYSPDLPTGDKLTYNGIQTMPTGGLSECWLLDAAGLEQLASIFKTGLTIEENEEFGFFETTLLSTVRGLSMYNSPIDMIVDMFWIPIDISDYCNLGSETQFTVNGEEYAGEYGLSSAYSWVKQRQGDALDMTGRIGNAIGESFAVKTQQDPTNEQKGSVKDG